MFLGGQPQPHPNGWGTSIPELFGTNIYADRDSNQILLGDEDR